MDRAPAPALGAYETLAPHYDAFTHEHDYEGWTGSLVRLLRAHGLRGRRLLDVACGTGRSFEPFQARGWAVTGCDLSPAMLAVARRRAAASTRLLPADMRTLPRLGEFDLVLCLDDAVNYLDGPDELERAFRSARRQLAPHGLYLFDTNTLATYAGPFSASWSVAAAGAEFHWAGETVEAVKPGGRFVAHLSIEDGSGDARVSSHVQRHHPVSRVRAALRRAGLRCLGVYGQTTDGRPCRPADEALHTKTIFVARANHDHSRRR